MHEIWELIEQRRDGRWYTLARATGLGVRSAYEVFAQGNPERTLAVRSVLSTDPTLSGATNYTSRLDGQRESRAESMRNDRNDPYSAGQNLGKALASVFLVETSPNPGDVFNLGWTFAKLCNYVAADDAKEFTEGFAQGIASAAPKALASPGG